MNAQDVKLVRIAVVLMHCTVLLEKTGIST